MIETIEEQVKIDINAKQQEILRSENEQTSIQSKIEVYASQLLELEGQEDEEDIKLNDLNIQFEEYEKQEKEITAIHLPGLEQEVKFAKDQVEKFIKTDWSAKKQDLQASKAEYKELFLAQMKELRENEDLKLQMEKLIAGAITCPECSHEFGLGNKEISIEEAKEFLPGFIDVIKEANENLQALEVVVNDIDEQLSLITDQEIEEKQNFSKIKSSMIEAEENLKSKKNQLNRIRENIDFVYSQIEAITSTNENKKEPIQKNIKSLNEKLETVLLSLKTKREELSALQYCSANFKKFRSYLANQSIKAIEAYTNHFLELMNTNLTVKIDGFRLKADGKIKEEIEVSISRDGFECENFYKFSSGEKTKVDIAGILALQSIINNNSNNGLNLICLDEIIESVDGTAAREIIKALNSLQQNILVITHTGYNSGVENVLRVEKKNGVSKILN
jgi:DNA repair exonuclease SbcCD ATPase subunit